MKSDFKQHTKLEYFFLDANCYLCYPLLAENHISSELWDIAG